MEENKPEKKPLPKNMYRKDNGLPIQVKYTNERCIEELERALQWFIEHEEAVLLSEYCSSPDATVTWSQFQYMTDPRKSKEAADIYKNKIRKITEARIAKRALIGTYKEGMAKFILVNQYGWKDKVESDITVSAKPIQFKFGNPELNKDEVEDTEYEDLTDQKELPDATE